jgi:hypothetical protein
MTISATALLNPSEPSYQISAQSCDPRGLLDLDLSGFLRRRESGGINTYSVSFFFQQPCKTVLEYIDVLRTHGYTNNATVVMNDATCCKITGLDYFIILDTAFGAKPITAFGSLEFCTHIKTLLAKEETNFSMNWWYTDDNNDFTEKELSLEFNYQLYDEFYPYVEGGLTAYFEAYLQSSAPILLLMGEPGTGKTTFIKQYIKQYSTQTVVTYDERIMSSDYFYIQYLLDAKKNLLVIEDADLLLAPRKDDNPVMSKLLNVSDGLVKLESKKIIFSTNIAVDSRIDEALIRPGRCFDVLKFRPLTYNETLKACEVANLTVPEEQREYCLSELFNRKRHSHKSHRIGFLHNGSEISVNP